MLILNCGVVNLEMDLKFVTEDLNHQRHRGPRDMTTLHALSFSHGVTRMRCCLLVCLTLNRGISKKLSSVACEDSCAACLTLIVKSLPEKWLQDAAYQQRFILNRCWITYQQWFLTWTAADKCSTATDNTFINNCSHLGPLLISFKLSIIVIVKNRCWYVWAYNYMPPSVSFYFPPKTLKSLHNCPLLALSDDVDAALSIATSICRPPPLSIGLLWLWRLALSCSDSGARARAPSSLTHACPLLSDHRGEVVPLPPRLVSAMF
jgi:hypothetical protein